MSKQTTHRTAALLARIDSSTEELVSKYQKIIELSTNEGNERATAATESFQIEANASSMVRTAEELLILTRSLKEAWTVGRIRPRDEDKEDLNEIEHTSQLSNELLEKIVNSKDKK